MIPFRIPNRVSLTDLSPIAKKKKNRDNSITARESPVSVYLSVCLSVRRALGRKQETWEKKKKKKGRKGKRKKGREEKRKIKGPVLCNSHQVTE